jgi:hypothetical protein
MGCSSPKDCDPQTNPYAPSGTRLKFSEVYEMGKKIVDSKSYRLICNRTFYECI